MSEQNILIKTEFPETDKYGYKAMLKTVNEQYRCPNDGAFLKWKDKQKRLAVCPKCVFQKVLGDE